MAKAKKKAAKVTKGSIKANKYSKLMLSASKELEEKKKALAKAEKAMATAQMNHTELLADVARLDMVERSLKALVEGTNPPQNVRYVYSYPQWVWYGNPYGWYWNGNTWSVNVGSYQQPYGSYNTAQNLQGQFTTNVNAASTNQAITASSANITLTNATLECSSGLSGIDPVSLTNCNTSGALLTSAGATSAPAWQTVTTTSAPTGDNSVYFTVDLSTGAGDPATEHLSVEEIEPYLNLAEVK